MHIKQVKKLDLVIVKTIINLLGNFNLAEMQGRTPRPILVNAADACGVLRTPAAPLSKKALRLASVAGGRYRPFRYASWTTANVFSDFLKGLG